LLLLAIWDHNEDQAELILLLVGIQYIHLPHPEHTPHNDSK